MRRLLKSGIRRIAGSEGPVNDVQHPALPRGQRNATVVSVAAQKGGVGKTTTSVNLASALVREHGLRVLLMDVDPQGHVYTAMKKQVHAGGGALSMYHMGVVKALLENNAMPLVGSGTSGGAIVAGVIAMFTDEELLHDIIQDDIAVRYPCLLYTSPSPRD